ncbi:cytochrome P450 [Crucibulum laeve]|uniref:Cytochrome P450 n=1 Tax=Crucibulum laeve TaxID=68775 RepID=A0A5C3M1Y0_9AGAR|nr:cytochrome P450 [Crucibulum laeve]
MAWLTWTNSLLGFLLVFFYYRSVDSNKPRRPPQPKPHFLLGNMRDMPKGGNEWVKYRDLGRKLGSDIVYLNIFGRSILAINSLRTANELLDKRGAVYSERPRLPYLKELSGWDWNLALMDYGRKFQLYRRLVQQYFQPSIVSNSYESLVKLETWKLVNNLLKTPDRFVNHLHNMAGGIILMITYGHKIKPQGDKYVELVEELRKSGSQTPGSRLVDTFPSLMKLPKWFPFAEFHQHATKSRALSERMRREPFEAAKQHQAAGTAIPSMTISLLESDFASEGFDREQTIMDCSGVVYGAGADTTVTSLTSFFLAMMLHKDVQRKAQAELDTVIGRSRMPQFSDRSSLPYVNAVLKEVLRWQPVTRLGIPHCAMNDDEYNGMHIPKGTVVFSNIWAILHDPDIYPDPESFIPERYLPDSSGEESKVPDPASASFGFGRRICPGRHLADSSMWIAIASVLHLFDISKIKASNGREIEPKVSYTSGVVNIPTPFKCAITPRFPQAASVIDDSIDLDGEN